MLRIMTEHKSRWRRTLTNIAHKVAGQDPAGRLKVPQIIRYGHKRRRSDGRVDSRQEEHEGNSI